MGRVRVSELIEQFGVDASTIRRDLNALEAKNALQRVHGGAIAIQNETESAGELETAIATRIARAVVATINEGETIFLGPGPLALALAKETISHSRLTVVTNGLEAAYWIAANTNHTLIVTGGQVGGHDLALGGELAKRAFNSLRADKVILEFAGVSAIGGLTEDSLPQAELTEILMDIGAEVIVLIPPERVSRVAVAFVAPVTEADVIVTAREAPSPALWDLSESGVRVILA
jgi:DeoR/GlpR family transcriptional regulator of sugar metabolism